VAGGVCSVCFRAMQAGTGAPQHPPQPPISQPPPSRVARPNYWLIALLCLFVLAFVGFRLAGLESNSNPDRNSVSTRKPLADAQGSILTDAFTPRLEKAGAKTGDVQISLSWENVNDIDLHCIAPCDDHIYFASRYSSDGGELDVDMNAAPPFTTQPVENIFWPPDGAPEGQYIVIVDHYANHGGTDPTTYSVRVLTKGRASYYSGRISYGDYPHKVCVFSP